MRILIIALSNQRLKDYVELSKALDAQKIETLIVEDSEYCTLSGSCIPKNISIPNSLNRVLIKSPSPKFIKLIKKFNPNIILVNSLPNKTLLAKLFNRPLFLHLRGDPWFENSWNKFYLPSFSSRIYTTYLNEYYNSSLKNTNFIFANSKWLEKRVKKYMPNHPTSVLYSGINPNNWHTNNYEESLNLEHPAIIGVFRFNIYLKVLGFKKFLRVIKKMPDVHFYFAGSGDFLHLIRNNCPPNLHLLGRISSTEVQCLLTSGDVFVHPSELDVLPRSVKEAALMEKPIVASNVGGIPEIIEDNVSGFLINNNNVNHWIEKITYFMDNPSVSRMFGKNAREHVIKKFDWNTIAKNFYETVNKYVYG